MTEWHPMWDPKTALLWEAFWCGAQAADAGIQQGSEDMRAAWNAWYAHGRGELYTQWLENMAA